MRKKALSMMTAAAISVAAFAGFSGFPDVTYATESPEREAAEICRYAEGLGTLQDMGRSRVDCVDAVLGPSDAEAVADILALCSVEGIRQRVGAEDKNRCVRRFQEIVLIGA